jgi:transcriptional regulator with XRE-family HTH domain
MIQKKHKDVIVMFGIRLRLLRLQAGLTQAELGARLNLTAGALGMYEHGRRRPSLSIIPEIADAFSVSCDFLLSGKGRNERETMLELMASMLIALDQNTDESQTTKHKRTSETHKKAL